MLIEVTIEDLASMICGTNPDHEIIKELENKCLGYYHGGFNDYWSWNRYALLKKSEEELYELYKFVKQNKS